MNGPFENQGDRNEVVAPLISKLEARCRDLGLSLKFASAGEPQSQPVGEVRSEDNSHASVRLALHRRDEFFGSIILTAHRHAEAESFLKSVVPAFETTIDDHLMISELESDVIDLADQITDAYEMLELMYALGNSMASLDDPDRFLSFTCRRVRETLGFGYVAVHLPDSADVGPLLAGKTHWDGGAREGTDVEHLNRLLAVMAQSEMSLDAFNGPQAVVRPLRNDQGVVGVMIAGDKLREAGNVSSYDTKLIDAIGGLLSTFLTNSRLYNEQREMALGVLESLSAAIDAKDPYTRGHAQRVAYLSQQIALALGFDAAQAERLRVAGLLHDVGKIGVAEAVLQKSGRLTRDE